MLNKGEIEHMHKLCCYNKVGTFKFIKIMLLCFVVIFTSMYMPVNKAFSAEEKGLVPAFPGAEGFGKWATGGRGGRVIEVTNLNDSGPGSLREAVEAKGPRIVVFRVSGIITLKTPLTIKNGDITIAGQTAPGDGICLRNMPLRIAAENVIIRYIRVRLGDTSGGEYDSIDVTGGYKVIIDHCSASWSVDETLSIGDGNMVTVQWCMITESLRNSTHSKGAHGYGSLIRGSNGSYYTYHHNLYAHHSSRNPRPGNYENYQEDPIGMTLDFVNNVVYNWGDTCGYNADTDSVSNYNFINNYYKRGPNSKDGPIFKESCPYARAYFSGNIYDGKLPDDPWDLVSIGFSSSAYESGYKMSKPFETESVIIDSAEEAYRKVLETAGASISRDAVDKRIVEEVKNGTGKIIDSQSEVGGWPKLSSTEPPVDTDHDGMPDSWEKEKGLNPNDVSDAAADRDFDGYTNIEEYINSLVPENAENISEPSNVGKNTMVLQIGNPIMEVNGAKQEIDPGRGTAPVILNNRTLVPIRSIIEAMGGTVGWDPDLKKITIQARGKTIEMWLDYTTITVNGQYEKIDVAPTVINDRTVVPVRFVVEFLGCGVNWDAATKTITIIY